MPRFATAFQPSAFQNNAYQISPSEDSGGGHKRDYSQALYQFKLIRKDRKKRKHIISRYNNIIAHANSKEIDAINRILIPFKIEQQLYDDEKLFLKEIIDIRQLQLSLLMQFSSILDRILELLNNISARIEQDKIEEEEFLLTLLLLHEEGAYA